MIGAPDIVISFINNLDFTESNMHSNKIENPSLHTQKKNKGAVFS
jgi:hypothetical protein